MNTFKETAKFIISKESLSFIKEDREFGEYTEYNIAKHLSDELAHRIIDILEHENEIVIKNFELRVGEFVPTNSVEYRKLCEWRPLVRCKDCKHRHQTTCPFLIANTYRTSDYDDYCSRGERREDVSNQE